MSDAPDTPALKTVICTDNLKQEFPVDVSKLVWRPTTCAFVVKDGKLLLSKQFNGFALPGGGVELGELPEDAVLREIREETGIIAQNSRLITVTNSFFKPTGYDDYYQSLIIYYQCEYVGGELSIDGFDEDESQFGGMPEWHDIDNLQDIDVSSTDDFRKYIGSLK